MELYYKSITKIAGEVPNLCTLKCYWSALAKTVALETSSKYRCHCVMPLGSLGDERYFNAIFHYYLIFA